MAGQACRVHCSAAQQPIGKWISAAVSGASARNRASLRSSPFTAQAVCSHSCVSSSSSRAPPPTVAAAGDARFPSCACLPPQVFDAVVVGSWRRVVSDHQCAALARGDRSRSWRESAATGSAGVGAEARPTGCSTSLALLSTNWASTEHVR